MSFDFTVTTFQLLLDLFMRTLNFTGTVWTFGLPTFNQTISTETFALRERISQAYTVWRTFHRFFCTFETFHYLVLSILGRGFVVVELLILSEGSRNKGPLFNIHFIIELFFHEGLQVILFYFQEFAEKISFGENCDHFLIEYT